MMVQNMVLPRLIVEVFERPYFGGKRGIIWQPVRYTGFLGFQDNISSVRVYKGPHFGRSTDYKVILYEHIDFQGKRLALGPGFYENLHDTSYNFGDRVTSIGFGSILDVPGPEWGTIPLIVHCYHDVDFKGRKITILRDVPNLDWVGIRNRMSSIRVIKGPNCPPKGASVVLFNHADFWGERLPIEILPRDTIKEVPNLHALPNSFGDMVSSIKIEGWSSSTEFSQTVADDEFNSNTMKPEWKWIDPKGGGVWTARQGYLEMNVSRGQDLYSGNMDAPRLVMQVSGDFAIETRLLVTRQQREHGGLLVWKSPEAFLRLEKTCGASHFRGDVRFERHVNRVYSLVGRGPGMRLNRYLFLRIERRGNQFSGFASSDGMSWAMCGSTYVGVGDPVMVGVHALCPGNLPPTLTRFEYFRLQKRPSEAAMYQPIILADPEMEEELQEAETFETMRQLI